MSKRERNCDLPHDQTEIYELLGKCHRSCVPITWLSEDGLVEMKSHLKKALAGAENKSEGAES